MPNTCEFVTNGGTGKRCQNGKRATGCPDGFFYCQRHFNSKGVQNMINKALARPEQSSVPKPTVSVQRDKKTSDCISEIFKTDRSDRPMMKPIMSRNDIQPLKNNVKLVQENKPTQQIKHLTEKPKTIFSTEVDEERDYFINSLREDFEASEPTRELEKIDDTEPFDYPYEEQEVEKKEEKADEPPKAVNGLKFSKYLEMGYWVTIHGLEQRVEYIKGYTKDLENNDVIRNNLELAFQEILWYFGIKDEFGDVSPCLVVAGTMLWLLFFRLMQNGVLDVLISKFYKPREGAIRSNPETQVNIDSANYSDIF